MRVLILTFGTKGDIEPYIALAARLNATGHEATIGTAEGFAADVGDLGIDFVASNTRMLTLIQEALPTMAGPTDLGRTLSAMNESMREAFDDQLRAARSIRPDIIVYHPKCLGAPHVAEFLGIPAVLSIPLPFFTRTSAYPIPFLSRPLGGRLNRLSYEFGRSSSLMYGGMINSFRRKLGLSPISRWTDPTLDPRGRPVDILYPYSPSVVPVPADYPPNAHVTGYWFTGRGSDWQPPTELREFLAAGEPPLYIGFGSMGFGKGARERGKAIAEAVETLGVRAIVATGWGGISLGESSNILAIDGAPHDWLFPQVSAVVHHGGAGTTGIGLAAGRPTLVCPFLGDQSFWAHRVHALGAGPHPLPRARITTDNLVGRLNDLLSDDGYSPVAHDLARRISAEDGTGRAVEVLERMA